MGIKSGSIKSAVSPNVVTVSDATLPSRGGWLLLVLMLAPVVAICGWETARFWQTDPTLSHAPLLVVIAAYCLYQRRDRLRSWNAANPVGLGVMTLTAVLFALAKRVDVLFLEALALLGLLAGTVLFLGGSKTLRAAGGSLGLLLFTLPFPAAIITRFQFFLQISSSAYAALIAGLMGIPVQRDGVSLMVIPAGMEKPVFSILVAQKCSGLASFMALFSLAYLIAWHTPLPLWRRLPLILLIFPLALVANAFRLALILLAGTHGNANLAQWVHDNEQPVLMLFCGVGLGIARWMLLQWFRHKEETVETPTAETLPTPKPISRLFTVRLLAANLVLGIAIFGVFWGRKLDDSMLPQDDFLARLNWNYRGWHAEKISVPKSEADLLQADSIRMERFVAPNQNWIEMTVIAGHRKQSIHTPAYCMRGDGWEVVSEETITLPVAGRQVDALRARIAKNGQEMLATYFFTDGTLCTPSLMRFQTIQMLRRFGSQQPLGALVRILTPLNASRDAMTERTNEFAQATLPVILNAIENHKRALKTSY